MTTDNTDRPPLTSISTNGTYKLKLIRPKIEKVRVWEDGTVSARLFFVDDKGFCLSKSFGTKYTKPLAMLIGKFSGKFTEELRMDATQAEFMQYIAPACGQTIAVGVEAVQDGEYNGKPQYKYKMTYPKGSQKPVVPDSPPATDTGKPQYKYKMTYPKGSQKFVVPDSPPATDTGAIPF